MKIFLLGAEIDSSIEQEIFPGLNQEFGFLVTVKAINGNVTSYYNVTEVHSMYDSPGSEPRIAIESDIHWTGSTRIVSEIESVTIVDDTCKQKHY